MPKLRQLLVASIVGLGLALAAAWLAQPAWADSPGQSSDECLACHATQGLAMTLPSGETLPLTVDHEAYADSIHGQGGYTCVQCHTDITTFPHPVFAAENLRDVTLQMYTVCRDCHAEQYENALDDVHQKALAAGEENAAVCTDCHGAHEIQRVTDPTDPSRLLPNARVQIPQTCARCHNAIFEIYRDSVHGAALLDNINPDVPTCIDCHGVHNIGDPTTAAFRLASPQICANCHTDEARMSKYGISTQVLSTYVADFHGTTVTLFEKESPDGETNKPVCIDCHGFHDIQRVDDPELGLQVKENLLGRCQRCHPDASPNFPTAWLSHYIPSPDKAPLVYYVDVFYRFFIPTVLGGMALLVVLDAGRRTYDWTRRRGRPSR